MTNKLIEDVTLLLSATVHDAVRQALKAKSAAVIAEKRDDLQDALDALKDLHAATIARHRIATGKSAGLNTDIAETTTKAEDYKTRGKKDLAITQLGLKKTKTEALAKCDASIVEMVTDLDSFEKAEVVLQARIDEFQTAHDNIEEALKVAKEKTQAADTLSDVTRLLSGAGVQGAEEWAEQIKETADVKFEMAFSKTAMPVDANTAAELEDEYEQLGKK